MLKMLAVRGPLAKKGVGWLDAIVEVRLPRPPASIPASSQASIPASMKRPSHSHTQKYLLSNVSTGLSKLSMLYTGSLASSFPAPPNPPPNLPSLLHVVLD